MLLQASHPQVESLRVVLQCYNLAHTSLILTNRPSNKEEGGFRVRASGLQKTIWLEFSINPSTFLYV